MSYELLREAEKVLRPLLEGAQVKGVCWGPNGRNLVCFEEREGIILSQSGERLKMRQFALTGDTRLGKRARKALSKAAVAPKKGEAPAYIAYCVRRHWRQQFDAGPVGEVDSRGAGSDVLIKKIYEAHKKAHPGCDPSNVEVLSPQMVKLGRLDQFLA